jgi:hypothetical protein
MASLDDTDGESEVGEFLTGECVVFGLEERTCGRRAGDVLDDYGKVAAVGAEEEITVLRLGG